MRHHNLRSPLRRPQRSRGEAQSDQSSQDRGLKVLVLTSNVMVWGRTPTKQKVIQPEVPVPMPDNKEDEDRDQSIDRSREEAKIEEQEQAVPEPIIVPIPYEESDYEARVPYDQYARWKAIEDFAISIAQTKENLKVYV
jgi:hypothetical protein